MNKQFWLSGLVRFLIYFSHWMILAHIPVIFKSNGCSDLQIGLLIGFFSLSAMVLMIPMGMFSDIFSSKKILLLGRFSVDQYVVDQVFITSVSPGFQR